MLHTKIDDRGLTYKVKQLKVTLSRCIVNGAYLRKLMLT